jgi:hypothetical protein
MQKMHVTHPNDSMLAEVPENDAEPLIDDLEENITWFEVDPLNSGNVQMYNEQNLGGIGEEDSPDDPETDGDPIAFATCSVLTFLTHRADYRRNSGIKDPQDKN